MTDHTSTPQLFTKIGKRGTIIVPASLRKQYNLAEGTAVITEPHPEGVLLKPVSLQASDTEATQAWKNWMQISQKMKLSPAEVSSLRDEGHS